MKAIAEPIDSATLATLPGHLESTALRLEDNLSYDRWAAVGELLVTVRESSSLWWLGDWLNYGERAYGERYSQAFTLLPYSYSFLSQVAWVCRSVMSFTRVKDITFQHHREVASLSTASQSEWLERARCEGWSSRDLAREVADSRRELAAQAMDAGALFEGGDWVGPDEPPAPAIAPVTLPDVVAYIKEHPEALPEVKKTVKQVQDSNNVHFSSESVHWYTPRPIIRAVEEFFDAIDLDPCAQPGSKTVPAAQYFTEEDDGLAQRWWGRVFMNPPYGREIGPWIEKACAAYESREIEAGILLLPARTDTDWWRRMRDYPACFVDGRIHFIHPEGKEGPASFPSALVYLGDEIDRFAAAFAHLGDVWTRYPLEAA